MNDVRNVSSPITLFIQWSTGTVSEYNAPVIVGAPPPPDSDRTRAQQMYGNGTFDFGGPEQLPPTAAAMRINQKCILKATTDDPIIISSSSDNGAARVIPAKKGDAAIKGRKKAIVIPDSDNDGVDIPKGDEHSLLVNIDEISEQDYQEPMESQKCKAKKSIAPGHASKQPVPAIGPTWSKKGKECARSIKGEKKFKSTKYVEVLDSDTDETVKGNVHGNRSQTCTDYQIAQRVAASEAHPICEKDVFDGVHESNYGAFVAYTDKLRHQNPCRELHPGSFCHQPWKNMWMLGHRSNRQAHLQSAKYP